MKASAASSSSSSRVPNAKNTTNQMTSAQKGSSVATGSSQRRPSFNNNSWNGRSQNQIKTIKFSSNPFVCSFFKNLIYLLHLFNQTNKK